ncbi:MAG: translation initiation factor IF-6 [Candidatus Bathyarchaeia archaeon]
MSLQYFQYLGNPNIGLFIIATDEFLLVPSGMSENKMEFLRGCFKVDRVLSLRIRGSKLLGALSVANSKGVLLPYGCEYEADLIREKLGVKAVSIQTFISLGNRILANDKAAIVDPQMPEDIMHIIEEALSVKVKRSTIANLPYVGSSAVASNKAAYTHPKIRQDEALLIEDFLDVSVHTGTVINGLPYVKLGLVVNQKGGVVGRGTSGSELMAISRCFSL